MRAFNAPSKYKNKRTIVDGITFDSKREAARYCQLRLMQKSGLISELQLQQRFPIIVNMVKICVYVSDFTYLTKAGQSVTEDVKGVKTAAYRLKKKLMKAVHNVDIKET